MSREVSYFFNGKVAVVTGGSTGIGRATALAFAEAGASVAILDTNPIPANECIKLIKDKGGHAVFLQCDVSHSEDVKLCFEKVIEQFHKIDFAFNNAGIEGEQAPFPESKEANWEHVINVNLKGVWACMKFEIELMLKQGGGAIVNCSSIAGLVGFPAISPYVASKHGVVGLTKTAALECAKSNIRVNAVCPGVIETPMIDRFVHGDCAARNNLVANEPMGRLGYPEEIANAVLWLCSNQASFITGQTLAIDGGWTAY